MNLFKVRPAIIVGSLGRSGSTLLWDATRKAMARRRFFISRGYFKHLASGEAWDLATSTFAPGVVYKTHDLGTALPYIPNGKALYIFDTPSETALSTLGCYYRYGESWFESHLKHLRTEGSVTDLINKDILKSRKHIESWLNCKTNDCLIIKYNSLWSLEKEINEFLEFPICLPKKLDRSKKIFANQEIRDAIKSAYREGDQFFDSLPVISRRFKSIP